MEVEIQGCIEMMESDKENVEDIRAHQEWGAKMKAKLRECMELLEPKQDRIYH